MLAYKAQVNGLVALYAIGVFTGFTMAGAGMVKHHLVAKEGHWKRSVLVNGFSALLSFSVVLIFAVAKFKEGAWLIVVVGPLLYLGLIRLHAQYQSEAEWLETGAAEASEAPVLRRHVVVVLVDRLDMATARALQYARTLAPDDLRAVHFDIDTKAARELESEWGRLGLARLPLDIIEVPDRRLGRAAIELVADATLDGDTECTVLLPRRSYARGWERFLHDRTADKIAAVLGQVPHVSATIVPFAVGGGRFGDRVRSYGRSVQRARLGRTNGDGNAPVDTEGRTGVDRVGRKDGPRRPGAVLAADQTLAQLAGATTPIASVRPRQRVRGGGPGQVDPDSAAGGDVEPRVRAERRHRRTPPRLPGPAEDRGHRPRGPAGGRGNGRDVGPPSGHAQPLLRAGPGRGERSHRGLSVVPEQGAEALAEIAHGCSTDYRAPRPGVGCDLLGASSHRDQTSTAAVPSAAAPH